MRISSNQMNLSVLQGLRQNDAAYSKVIEQMSTGDRITKLSDDPLGSVRLMSLERESKSLDQWQANADRLNSRLTQAETYLDSSTNVVLRMQDLILNARNGSSTQEDREALAQELRVLQTSLIDFANAQDDRGNYLFSGSRTDTKAVGDTGSGFVFQGDNQDQSIPIAKSTKIDANITADTAFFNGGNFFNDIQAVIDDIDSGSASLDTTTENALEGINRTIDGLGEAISTVGARMKTASTIQQAQQDLSINNDKISGQIRDLDYAEAVTRVNKIETALSTTQKTFAKVSQQSLFNYI